MNNKTKRLGLFIALSALLMGVTLSSMTSKTASVNASAAVPTGYSRIWIQTKSWIATGGASLRYKAWRSSDNTYLNTPDDIGFAPVVYEISGTVVSGSYSIAKVYYYDIDTSAAMNYDTFRFLRLSIDGTTILNESANILLSTWNNRNYRYISSTTGDMNLGTNSWTIANFKTLTGITTMKTCLDSAKVLELLMGYESLDYNTQTLRDAALLASSYSTEYDYVSDNDGTPDDSYGTLYNYTTNTTTVNLLNKIKYMVKVYDGGHATSLYVSYWGTTATNGIENIKESSSKPRLDILIVLLLGGMTFLGFFFFQRKSSLE